VVDIFDEVEEDLRAERAQRLLRKYGWVIIAAGVALIGIAAGWQGWRWWQNKRDLAAATAYIAAVDSAQTAGPGSDPATRQHAIQAFEQVAAQAPEGYRTLARLRAAALMADNGDLQGAATIYNQIASDSGADPLLRGLADLLWAQRLLDSADPGLLAARLKALAAPDNPWRPLAEEQLALLDLRQGHVAAAKETLRKLAQDGGLPQDLRGRAGGLLAQLGG
jgi:hypothetical protein